MKWDENVSNLKDVSSGVVFQRPSKSGEHLDDVFRRKHTEESIQEDLQADGKRLAAVQSQTGNVKDTIGQRWFHTASSSASSSASASSGPWSGSQAQFIQRCADNNNKRIQSEIN